MEISKNTRMEELGLRGSEPEVPETFDVAGLGSGLKLMEAKPFTLTRASAQAHLELPSFVGERPVRDRHVENLMGAMKRKTFLPELVSLATCWLDGKEYRINGQHTCWAVYNMDEKVHYTVKLLKYRAQTEADLRRLYGSFDRGASRTNSNVLLSYLAGADGFTDWGNHVIRTLSEGLALWVWETPDTRKAHDADDRAYLMQKEHYPLVKKVGDFLATADLGGSGRHLRRASVVGAMFATFRLPAKDKPAQEFWARVQDGVGLVSKHDPRYRLREYLRESSVGGRTALRKKVDAEYMYRACIYCWNAWRRGEEQKQITVQASANRPKAI